jgi:O-antigen/teichoic acid export membrane protein
MSAAAVATTRSLFRNSVSQILGRLLLSAVRLVTASLIVRLVGSVRFGEYTLVLSFLLIFEWLSDFGQTDIAVRDIARRPEREVEVLHALAQLKALQGAAASLLLPLTVLLLGYPRPLVEAAAIGSLGLLAYAGVQVFRTVFKVRMRMERDVLAELASALVLVPLTWWACRNGAGVQVLIACYAASRLVFFGLAVAMARGEVAKWAPPPRGLALQLLRTALPLGLSGLLVWLYDAIAPVLLSKIADMHAVALYSAPARYVFAVLALVQALNTAFFPLLSRQWSKAGDEFSALQQTALEASVLIAVGFICVAAASAGFLMNLIGPGVVQAAPVLQLMCCIVLIRAVSIAMSPLIIIVGRVGLSMWLTIGSLALQAALLPILVPRYGALGAVAGYLAVEVATIVPTVLVGQSASGVRLAWGRPGLLVGCGLAALAATRLSPLWGGWTGGGLCGLLFLAFALASNAVPAAKLRRVYDELTSRAAAPAGADGQGPA